MARTTHSMVKLCFDVAVVYQSKEPMKKPGITSADAWVLLWRQKDNESTHKRILKLMYKSKTDQALTWSDYTELKSALSRETHDSEIPVLSVLDVSAKSEHGQLSIRRTTKLNISEIDFVQQSNYFDTWVQRITLWWNNARALAGYTGLSEDFLESSKSSVIRYLVNPELKPDSDSIILSDRVTNIRERLYRSGFMYKRIMVLKSLLAKLDSDYE